MASYSETKRYAQFEDRGIVEHFDGDAPSVHDLKLMAAIDSLVAIGNTVEDATARLADLICTACNPVPSVTHGYSREFCEERRLQQNTARVQLRKLPHGQEILDYELLNWI